MESYLNRKGEQRQLLVKIKLKNINPCFKRNKQQVCKKQVLNTFLLQCGQIVRSVFYWIATYFPEIEPVKAVRNKKEMWAKISTDIEGRSAKQCEQRYKSVLKRKKATVENNQTSGGKRQRAEFAQEIKNINEMDDLSRI